MPDRDPLIQITVEYSEQLYMDQSIKVDMPFPLPPCTEPANAWGSNLFIRLVQHTVLPFAAIAMPVLTNNTANDISLDPPTLEM